MNFQKKDGMNYAPKSGIVKKVVEENEFVFSAVSLKHGHIYGMTNGLIEAGATLKYVYDDDPELVKKFVSTYPQAIIATSLEEVLNDTETKLIAAADVTNRRATLGALVMRHHKDYFTDKAPATTLNDIELIRKTVEETKQKYFVYYSERLHVEGSVFAGDLIKQGAIGKVIQVVGLGPHRLNKPTRPDWFFEKEKYGGILCDIGSHQIEQFLYFAGSDNATVISSKIANYNNPDYPELDDFGDCTLVCDNGVSCYFRVDWFTPDGLSTWGDGRLIIIGTEGYLEVRKYVDVSKDAKGDNVYLVNKDGEFYYNVNGKVGFPFFGEMILDCINRTEKSMTQEHIIKAAELAVIAQNKAIKIK